MKRPRTFYGWESDGMFFVSLWPRAAVEAKYKDDLGARARGKGAEIFDTKEDAIRECVKKRTDALGKPVRAWEDNG